MIVAQVEEAESRQETLKEIEKEAQKGSSQKDTSQTAGIPRKGPSFAFPKAPSLGDTHQGAV